MCQHYLKPVITSFKKLLGNLDVECTVSVLCAPKFPADLHVHIVQFVKKKKKKKILIFYETFLHVLKIIPQFDLRLFTKWSNLIEPDSFILCPLTDSTSHTHTHTHTHTHIQTNTHIHNIHAKYSILSELFLSETNSKRSENSNKYSPNNVHWASKETYHFFRTTLTKSHCIKINNIWTQISFNTPYKEYLKKTRFSRVKKERTRLNHERSFFENCKNCSPSELWASSMEVAYSEHSIAIHSISMVGYVNAVWLLSASNSQPERQAVSVIFENWPLAISSHLSPLWLK